jgi:hypothetical protein
MLRISERDQGLKPGRVPKGKAAFPNPMGPMQAQMKEKKKDTTDRPGFEG